MSANIPNNPVAIQRFFTSRDNNANAETYVGQEQRLWYNPITNGIYVSDGNTAGGILVGGGGSGNGVPGGPTNSIQYNAGSGVFSGTSNILVSGNGVSVTGNITTATFFIGNGSQLTGLPVQSGTYSNANVANYLPTDTTIININSNVANTNGNVANLSSNITTLQGQVYANSNVATFLSNFGSNTISTTGNITGNNISANALSISGSFTQNGLYISPANLITVPDNGTYSQTHNLSTSTSFNILYVTAGGYTVTLNMPTAPVNGQQCSFSIINNTVTLAVGTGTVVPTFAGAPTAGISYQYTYYSGTSTWYAF